VIELDRLIRYLETHAIYIITGLIIFIVGFAFIRYLIKRGSKRSRDYSIEYTAALNYLLNGNTALALEKFRETVKKNTNNINAYIKIGDILREQGESMRAIKVHKGLTVRNNLNALDRIEILRSLFKDYRIAGKYDSAIKVSEELLVLTKYEDWVREDQLALYEEMEAWDKAFDLRKRMSKRKNETEYTKLMALYKVESGLQLTRRGSEHDGRLKFREAIKIDKKCAPAYLYLSDSYIREKRLSDALTELKRFTKNVSHLSFLAFDRMKEILFMQGDFGEIESIYSSMISENPDLHEARFALADLYERKGDVDRAIELCKKVLERKPDSKIAKEYLVNYYEQINEKDSALKIALELINASLSEERKFVCEKCSFTSNRPYWHCPQCKSWNSFVS